MDEQTRQGIIDTYAGWHSHLRDSGRAAEETARETGWSVAEVIGVIEAHEGN